MTMNWKKTLVATTLLMGLSDHHAWAEKVGIVQVIDHPALNRTCQGIIDTLAKKGLAPKKCQSAQGKSDLALQIVQKYLGDPVEVIVALATMPSQIAVKSTKDTPVVFASVTDPKGAKLLDSDVPVTGVSNFVDLEPQIALMKRLLKKEKIKIGVIYNCGEPNSVVLVDKMRSITDVEWVFVRALNVSDVAQATQQLVAENVNIIFINNDSTALSTIDNIVTIATPHKIPVFSSDVDTIEKGVLASLGPDQYDIGVQAGEMVIQIFDGKPAKEIAVGYPRKVETHINLKKAKELGIEISADLKKSAILTGE